MASWAASRVPRRDVRSAAWAAAVSCGERRLRGVHGEYRSLLVICYYLISIRKTDRDKIPMKWIHDPNRDTKKFTLPRPSLCHAVPSPAVA